MLNIKNLTVHKHYSQISENYQLILPIDLEVLIPEDDSVRLLRLMIEELNYTKLYEINEIEFENVFIDGTKIEANANKYTFIWKKSVNKNELKLEKK